MRLCRCETVPSCVVVVSFGCALARLCESQKPNRRACVVAMVLARNAQKAAAVMVNFVKH
jgi:hypothetical protein